jgi:REP element-mobilizing transposase RayT
MARRRHFAPDQDLVHVSFKCVGDAFLMRPDAYTSFVIASALEQAAEKYGVRIHAFCFLSNHAHLLLGIQGCRLDSFMQYLKSLIALALNLHRERDGAFFKRRYRCEVILSNEAAVGIEQYVHQQAVKHELVERAVEWPGLCSYAAVIEGRSAVEASWFDEESWRELSGRRDERGNFVRTASVPLTALPHRVGLSDLELGAQRRALVLNMQDLEAQVARKRRDDGSRRLPRPDKYTTQDPNGVPPGRRRKSKTPQPLAHGTDEQVKAYEESYAEVMAAYDLASRRYRETGKLCPFPAGTFPPRIPTPREVL